MERFLWRDWFYRAKRCSGRRLGEAQMVLVRCLPSTSMAQVTGTCIALDHLPNLIMLTTTGWLRTAHFFYQVTSCMERRDSVAVQVSVPYLPSISTAQGLRI